MKDKINYFEQLLRVKFVNPSTGVSILGDMNERIWEGHLPYSYFDDSGNSLVANARRGFLIDDNFKTVTFAYASSINRKLS